jgi:site-specific DNA recombinase
MIDESEAKIVRRIFIEYTSGRSTRDIAADLTREGVPSPGATRHKNKAGRTTWNHQCITGGRHGRGIIGNLLYIGEIHWNVRSTILNPETQKKQKRRNPEERHIIVKNAELRIVPQALWDRAQKVRSERAIHMFGPTGSRSADPWSRATTSIRLQESFGAAFAMAICESLNPRGMADHAPHAPTRISEAPASIPAALTWTFY